MKFKKQIEPDILPVAMKFKNLTILQFKPHEPDGFRSTMVAIIKHVFTNYYLCEGMAESGKCGGIFTDLIDISGVD
jgi:hypothetical protein